MLEATKLHDDPRRAEELAHIIGEITSRVVSEINSLLEHYHTEGVSAEDLISISFNVGINIVGTVSSSIAYNQCEELDAMVEIVQMALPERMKELYAAIIAKKKKTETVN